ncbi:MAG TPA: NUMOD3 domain-containing DNA-binding protein, partial [Candidatus Nitrosopolaris rasttigaisensis]|nr:NUMOD3 domain-containing DNA-binding protein [Candidatus Nitrosopolaris rasttigaisensis]
LGLHRLLCCCYEHLPKKKMWNAFMLMCGGNKSLHYYELARKMQSENMKGVNNPRYGTTSNLGYKHTDETLQYLYEINVGDKNPMYGKESWNKGLTKNDPRVAKYSEKLLGIKRSKDRIAKHADSISCEWSICNPDGNILLIKNLRKFCRDNDLCSSSIWKLLKGKTVSNNYKGYSKPL